MLDLNLPPPELQMQEEDLNPQYCTQVAPDLATTSYHNVIDSHSNSVAAEVPTLSEIRLSLEDTHLDANNENDAGVSNTSENGGDGSDDSEGVEEFREVFSTPQEPYVGQTFMSREEARIFYNAYAKKKGFSVRTNTSRRSLVTYVLEKVQFVCNKEGRGKQGRTSTEQVIENQNSGTETSDSECLETSAPHIGKKRKREKMIYTKCRARMSIKLIEGKWEVIQFIAEHNHPLVNKPSLSKFLKSHAQIPDEEIKFLRILHNCNLETSRMMQLMAELYGSAHLTPYTVKHVSNLRSKIRAETATNDIAEAVAHFYEMKKEDPNFFFEVKLDKNGKLQYMFWADSAAREAYKTYHDCISFDSTYLTNKYKMPFAPFIAINRHGQSIQVGCGFLTNESAGSYEWLFEKFLEAMDGQQPKNIITDQDLSMAAAIRKVFPASNHRCCRWHILSKVKPKLHAYFSKKGNMQIEFYDIIDYSLSISEFESRWNEMIELHSAQDNEILAHLYEIRQLWVPAYFMNCFFPFLQSTQRSEGYNAVLKKYVNPSNSVLEFINQYKKIQDKTDVAECGQDYRTDQKLPELWSRYPIEKHALDVYTRKIYWVFRGELEKTTEYVSRIMSPNLFKLSPIVEFVTGYGTKSYEVTFVPDASYFSCQCCKFERDGVLCCHILKVATEHGVKMIPEQYILKRWTPLENAVTISAFPGIMQPPMPERSKKALRFADLATSLAKIAVSASVSDEMADVVRSHVHSMESELDALKKSKKKKKSSTTNTPAAVTQEAVGSSSIPTTGAENNEVPTEQPTEDSNQVPTAVTHPGNPSLTKSKGRPRQRRFRSSTEGNAKTSKKQGGTSNILQQLGLM